MGVCRLVLEHGDHQLVLAPGVYFLGRGDDADVLLADPLVSRRHAAVRVSACGLVVIEDLGSSNGVSVNGTVVSTPRALEPDDRILIGSQELRLRLAEKVDTASAHARTDRLQVGRSALPPRRPAIDGEVRSLEKLSRREQEVLRLLACGLSQREIGEMLELSVKTVETYRSRIAEKLELRTRPELVRYAINAGLLRPD